MNDKNVEYYNQNAESFFAGTVNVDMSLWRDKFEHYIEDSGSRAGEDSKATDIIPDASGSAGSAGMRVLDAGCGSGRDSLAFKQHGYLVTAFDASSEMCRMASELIGQEVLQMRFDEVEFTDEFDGIWACASLLHVPHAELPNVLAGLSRALKAKGIMYLSFKYGEGSRQRGERIFSDFTEETVRALLDRCGFETVECGTSSDVRPDRAAETWVNVIARKQ